MNEDFKTSKGGYKYKELEIEDSDVRIKLFNTNKPQRLIEEGETYQEYKIRRKFNNAVLKQKRRGTLIWLSKNPQDLMKGNTSTSWGTMTKERMEEMEKLLKENE